MQTFEQVSATTPTRVLGIDCSRRTSTCSDFVVWQLLAELCLRSLTTWLEDHVPFTTTEVRPQPTKIRSEVRSYAIPVGLSHGASGQDLMVFPYSGWNRYALCAIESALIVLAPRIVATVATIVYLSGESWPLRVAASDER